MEETKNTVADTGKVKFSIR